MISTISFLKVTQAKPPFVEYSTDKTGVFIRMFDSAYPEYLYQWHKDDEDRNIEILSEGEDWLFQFDNEVPLQIKKGQNIYIPKDMWHRLIKGRKKLLLSIEKLG